MNLPEFYAELEKLPHEWVVKKNKNSVLSPIRTKIGSLCPIEAITNKSVDDGCQMLNLGKELSVPIIDAADWDTKSEVRLELMRILKPEIVEVI